MVYGDLKIFDIIIFAVIAIFLVFRLRNILGKKTGFQKQINEDSIVTKKTKEAKTITPQLQDNLSKLSIAYEALKDFDHKNFLDGAKLAFETIINAFNKGEKKTLKGLLTKNVFNSFESAIDGGNHDPSYQFYSLIVEGIDNVVIEDDVIKITIRFISEQFKNNDESTVSKRQDIWTFEKNISNKDLRWFLSST